MNIWDRVIQRLHKWVSLRKCSKNDTMSLKKYAMFCWDKKLVPPMGIIVSMVAPLEAMRLPTKLPIARMLL